jgi:pyruvate formate lyase activating enzyme
MAPAGLLFNIQKFSLHDGPGIRTVVFFKGCPLSCRWCSNPESQRADVLWWNPQPGGAATGTAGATTGAGGPVPDSREYTLEETLAICLQDRPFYEESGTGNTTAAGNSQGERGGVTLSGGEALTQGEFAAALLEALGAEGIHTALETSGHAPADVFTRVTAAAALILFDVKHYDSRRHREGTGVDNALVLDNLRSALAAGRNLLPRIPVIPDYNASPEDAAGFARLFVSLDLHRVQLLPFHQFGAQKYAALGRPYALEGVPQLHSEDLEEYRKVFAENGVDAFV